MKHQRRSNPPNRQTMVELVTLLLLATIATSTCNNFLHSVSVGIRSATVVSTPNRLFNPKRSHNPTTYTSNSRISRRNIHKNVVDTVERNNDLSEDDSIKLSSSSSSPQSTTSIHNSRGGAKARAKAKAISAPLNFWENMICGAVSRSVAQVATHPANTMKTLLQSNRDVAKTLTLRQMARVQNLKMLTRGAGAQFILSIPHGAINFAVLEYVRKNMSNLVMKSEWATKKKETSAAFGPAMDFLSSAVATICVSVISTPQMMIVDNIMAGTYPNLPKALHGLSAEKGLMGFYAGW